MQDKILEILKSWSRELPDKNCYGDRAIDYENLEDIASEISSQFTVIAEGEVCYTKLKNMDRTHYQILNIGGATFNGIVREAIEEREGKKIKLILWEEK